MAAIQGRRRQDGSGLVDALEDHTESAARALGDVEDSMQRTNLYHAGRLGARKVVAIEGVLRAAVRRELTDDPTRFFLAGKLVTDDVPINTEVETPRKETCLGRLLEKPSCALRARGRQHVVGDRRCL